jgi:hypothetical protein
MGDGPAEVFHPGRSPRARSAGFCITIAVRSSIFDQGAALSALTAFGLFAVTAMLVFYALEKRSPWFILAFAFACGLGSIYGFLQGAWPFGVVEAIWSAVAVRHWWQARWPPQ